MGNISYAFGNVTISAPKYSDIEVLVATHRVINEKAWRPTTIEGSPSEADCITSCKRTCLSDTSFYSLWELEYSREYR